MKILLAQMSFLGDVVLSTPVISSLRQLYPTAKISVLTTAQARPLVLYNPDVSDAIAFDKHGSARGVRGLLMMAEELRERRFDIAFSLHRSLRTAILLRLAGIPKRYGFAEAAGAFLYSRTVPRDTGVHDVLRNLSLLRVVGADPQLLPQRLVLEMPGELLDRAASQVGGGQEAERRLIAVAPGSVWETKRWPAENFAQLLRRLDAGGFRVVLVGGPSDRARAEEVIQQSGTPVMNTVGETTLLEAAAVIRHSAALITNDSAPLHFASALGIPTVAIFCSTVPEFGFGPWGTRSQSLGLDSLPCRPCGRHGRKACPLGHFACGRNLSPDAVFSALESVLATPERI